MANLSIYNAFERMWTHISNVLSTKANTVDLDSLSEEFDNRINGISETLENKMDKENPTGTGSFSLNRKNGTTVGQGSFTEGLGNTASGQGSHAEGIQTVASGQASHAEGQSSVASGAMSHAEGLSNATGDMSHAEGSGTTAEGNYSHSEGTTTTAKGIASHAEGGNIDSNGNGLSNITVSSSDFSGITEDIVIVGSQAYGIQSHAEGAQTLAFGYSSHAEGNQTKSFGNYSHAEGIMTTASYDAAHAEGNRTKASGVFSHAEGSNSTASGMVSHAEGNATVARGVFSHAEGDHTLATRDYQHVQGRYNVEDTLVNYHAHIIGNGTSESARSNAHTVDWDGNAWYAGDIRVGGTSYEDANDVATINEIFDITTKSYLNSINWDYNIANREIYRDNLYFVLEDAPSLEQVRNFGSISFVYNGQNKACSSADPAISLVTLGSSDAPSAIIITYEDKELAAFVYASEQLEGVSQNGTYLLYESADYLTKSIFIPNYSFTSVKKTLKEDYIKEYLKDLCKIQICTWEADD